MTAQGRDSSVAVAGSLRSEVAFSVDPIADTVSAHFGRKRTKSVTQVKAALVVLGQAQQEAGRLQLV